MSYDDIPVWSFVGRPLFVRSGTRGVEAHALLFTHLHFDLRYNGDRVVEVNIEPDPSQTVDTTNGTTDSVTARFTYSAKWTPSSVAFEHRLDRYYEAAKLPNVMQAHTATLAVMCFMLLATLFSCVALCRLTAVPGIVAASRTQHYGRQLASPQELVIGRQDSNAAVGLHAAGSSGTTGAAPVNISLDFNICTQPLHGWCFYSTLPAVSQANLLSAMVGVGAQLLVVAVGLSVLWLCGYVHPYSGGRLPLACLVLYALTSGVAGYVSGLHYASLGGTQWPSNAALCAVLYGGPLLAIFAATNCIAAAHRSTAAAPLGAVAALLALWALVAVPHTALGGWLAARNSSHTEPALFRDTRHIGSDRAAGVDWHQAPAGLARTIAWCALQAMLAGCVPYSATGLQLYHVFASLWTHKVYTLPSLHVPMFLLFVGLSALSTVAVSFFRILHEKSSVGSLDSYDCLPRRPGMHCAGCRWRWNAFLSGGASGLFVACYGVYFFATHTRMGGLLQTSFYFGYNAVLCYALSLALGSAGLCATQLFMGALR